MSEDEVLQVIESTVRDQLAPSEVSVRVSRGIDDDGDNILNVMVIIEAKTAPDRGKMLGLVRHIRSNLQDATSAGFPLVRFISKRDAAKLDFEAA